MDTDRNLVFGVLALQADVLDRDWFVDATTPPSIVPSSSNSGSEFEDITEQRRTETALREASTELDRLRRGAQR